MLRYIVDVFGGLLIHYQTKIRRRLAEERPRVGGPGPCNKTDSPTAPQWGAKVHGRGG